MMGTFLLEGIQQHKPIRDEVFFSLRKAILQGHFKPGDRLVEQELAQQMGISRTPIREALRKLELEGLVDHVPRRGVVVVGITVEDAAEIYAMCAVLEGLAAGLAAQKRTYEELRQLNKILLEMEEYIQANNIIRLRAVHTHFHNCIARISDSPKLYQTIVSLREHVENFTETSYSWSEKSQNGWKEHEEIVMAIHEADAEKAEHAARNHLMQVQDALSKKMFKNTV
jgi:DNA-binding GntR family transcriptional regulator